MAIEHYKAYSNDAEKYGYHNLTYQKNDEQACGVCVAVVLAMILLIAGPTMIGCGVSFGNPSVWAAGAGLLAIGILSASAAIAAMCAQSGCKCLKSTSDES